MIPLINHDSSEGEQWGRFNFYPYIDIYIYCMYNIITIKPHPNGESQPSQVQTSWAPHRRFRSEEFRKTWLRRLTNPPRVLRGGLQGCPKTFTDTYAYAFIAVYVCIYTYMYIYIYNFVYRHVLFYLIYISIHMKLVRDTNDLSKIAVPMGEHDEHHTTWWFSDIQCGHPQL